MSKSSIAEMSWTPSRSRTIFGTRRQPGGAARQLEDPKSLSITCEGLFRRPVGERQRVHTKRPLHHRGKHRDINVHEVLDTSMHQDSRASCRLRSRARFWLARLPRRSPPTRHPRGVDPQFAELGSSAPALSATVIPACLSAQSSAKSATSSHPSMAGSRCGPSNSTISVTVLDL
jgi:hypothetical protein